MVINKIISISPRYLEYSPNTKKHRFQIVMESVSSQKEDVLIVTAPTGAGKTYALAELAKKAKGSFSSKLLVISPTNALSTQISRDLSLFSSDIAVRRWAASDFDNTGIQRNLEMINNTQTYDVIVSNPDLLHLLTTNIYARKDGPQRHRTFEDAMLRFGVHVFDEYHSYDERMMASVIAYMLKSKSIPACAHHKYIFLSATPNKSLPELLKMFNFSIMHIEETETTIMPTRGRQIKGNLTVELNTQHITEFMQCLPKPRTGSPRTLIIFDRFIDEEQFLNCLLKNGYQLGSEKDVIPMTGRDTKGVLGQDDWDKASIITATSKADLGLNIDKLDLLVMEKGWITSQFWQRFGRAGRGRDAKVIISLPEEMGSLIESIDVGDLDAINLLVSRIMEEQKFSANKVLDYVGFYLATTEFFIRKAGLREHIREITLPSRAAQSRGLLRKAYFISGEFSTVSIRQAIDEYIRRLMTSIALLRGQSLEVSCIYPRGDAQLVTKDNLEYILKWTKNRKLEKGEYKIENFLEKPNNRIQITLPGMPNPIVLVKSKEKPEWKTWSDYVSKLISTLVSKSDEGEKTDAINAFEQVLLRLEPDTLAPLEVNLDDQFI